MANGDRIIQVPEGEYAKYLAEVAARIADEKASKREARWRAIIGSVVGFLAVVGYSNFGSMKSDLQTLLSAQLTAKVATEVDSYFQTHKDQLSQAAIAEIRKDVDGKLAFTQFVAAVNDLARPGRDGFSHAERDAANALLSEVVRSPAIVERPEFKAALEKLVDTYFKADQEQYIDDIDKILGAVAVQTPGIAWTMVTHYGLRVAGVAELDDSLVFRFEKYADAAERHRFTEVSTPFRMALAFRRAGGKRTKAIEDYIETARHFTPGDKKQFTDLLEKFQASDKGRDANGKLVRSARVFRRLCRLYRLPLLSIMNDGGTMSNGSPEELMRNLQRLLDSESAGESDDTRRPQPAPAT